jgi:polysaccharide export outer membrane protein
MTIRPSRLVTAGFLAIACSVCLGGRGAACQTDQSQTTAPAPTTDSATQPPSADVKKPHDSSYVIGDDDLLGINVWGEADLTQQVPVRSDGKISLPLVGEVQAAGQTPLQLEQEIATKLHAYITQPDVTVMVLKINSEKFNILGRVAKPGSYSLTSATTILDAIAQAGGFQDFAKQKDIYILRQNPSGGESRIAFNYKDVIKGKHPEQNIKVEPRDTIVVP